MCIRDRDRVAEQNGVILCHIFYTPRNGRTGSRVILLFVGTAAGDVYKRQLRIPLPEAVGRLHPGQTFHINVKEIGVERFPGQPFQKRDAQSFQIIASYCGKRYMCNSQCGTVRTPVSYTHLDVYKRQA